MVRRGLSRKTFNFISYPAIIIFKQYSKFYKLMQFFVHETLGFFVQLASVQQ